MVICVLGPTGIGKTKLSIELAKRLNGEIINGDSTQVYRGLDIATAKVTEKEKENIPHHLFDIKDIDENYTVYDFQKDARNKLEEIISKNKIPIIVGGTGLYIKAALYDYKFEKENLSINSYDDLTNEKLYLMLNKVDPDNNIHPNNRKRIIRAINYYNNTNSKLSSKEKTDIVLYDVIFIELNTDRETLYTRINNRVDRMIQMGLLDEAKKIYETGIRSKAVMTPIGYKELFQYFDGDITLEEAIELIKQRSRRYAKRQETWNKHQMNTIKFNTNFNDFGKTVDEVYSYINNLYKSN